MDSGLYKSIVWVRALIDALERRGVVADALLSGTSMSSLPLADSFARVSLWEWTQLVARALDVTGDPGLGITIVSDASHHLQHILGPITLACASLRQAMDKFDRYAALLGNASRFDLVEEGNRAYLAYSPVSVHPWHPAFEAELALGLVYRSAIRLAKLDGDAEEVWFAHAAPEYAARYNEVFRCPVRFGGSRNAILFPRRCLDAPHVHSDPVLLDVLCDAAEKLLARQRVPDLPERVRAILLNESDLRRVTAARVAQLLKLDARSLRTQLVKAHVSWSQLRDEARCRIACQQLQRGDRRLGELSARLGFSNQSAFNRAFKRWTGVTPLKYAHEFAWRRFAEAHGERRPEQ